MMTNAPSLDLVEFVETNILPQYAQFDRAHNLEHVTRVIRNALELVRLTGADINMVYVIAAYHDIGLTGPRAVHHLTGGKILAADARLRRWFTADQLTVMKEAVEDHRASASHAPRSLYGKIIAEADRDLQPDAIFRRAIDYGIAHYPELDNEQQWQRFARHMDEKYSVRGYITLWLPGTPNERRLAELRHIISQPQLLRQHFDRHYSTLRRQLSSTNNSNK